MDTIKNQIDKLTATALAIIETTVSLTAERDQLRVELEKAAATFHHMAHGNEMLGLPVMAEACRIAETSSRRLLGVK